MEVIKHNYYNVCTTKNLKKKIDEHDLILTKVDKGNKVVLKRSEYIRKMHGHLTSMKRLFVMTILDFLFIMRKFGKEYDSKGCSRIRMVNRPQSRISNRAIGRCLRP